MTFFRQFESFEPKTGIVPAAPFGLLPDIATRARAILRARSRPQIVHAAETIDWMIDNYFTAQKQEVVRKICERGHWELGDTVYSIRTEEEAEALLNDWPVGAEHQRPVFPSAENTTYTAVLKDGIGGYVLDDDPDLAGESAPRAWLPSPDSCSPSQQTACLSGPRSRCIRI